MLKEQRQQLADSRDTFEAEVLQKWGHTVDDSKRIKLNVGGQVFETSPSTLAQDRFSLLAAIVTQAPPAGGHAAASAAASDAGAAESKAASTHGDDAAAAPDGDGTAAPPSPAGSAGGTPPVPPTPAMTGGGGSHFAVDGHGMVFIDRDWWLFRHILAFLRHGALPSNLALLRQLYIESAYYRLHSLRTAIERKLAADDVPGEVLDDDTQGLLPGDAAHGAALPGPHAAYLQGPSGHDAPLDTTSATVRQDIAARAAEALSWATTGHGLSRGLGASGAPWVPGAGGGASSLAAARASPAPRSLAGSLGGVRNMAALLASDELDGGWGGLPAAGRGAWGGLPQSEVDQLASELQTAEAARRGGRHRRHRRGGREGGGSARSEGGHSSTASSAGVSSQRSGGGEAGRFGLAAATGRSSQGLSLDERASATKLPDRLGLWGGR